MMDNMQMLQREIEALRKRLNEEAKKGLLTQECYQASVQVDRLVVEYMRLREERAASRAEEDGQAGYGACDGRVGLPYYG